MIILEKEPFFNYLLMESATSVQQSFFQHLKAVLPPHLAMVEEVAALLHISTDSAYRRIRCEKPLTIDEMMTPASHYKLSLDQFLQLDSDTFLFSGKLANATDHIFEKWMGNLLQQIQYINSFQDKHLYYLAKDIPLMQQFFVPELITFKSFFWRKSILHYDDLKGKKFSLRTLEPLHVQLAERIQDVYTQIPATDIWNTESIIVPSAR